jgi:hypothetical protein
MKCDAYWWGEYWNYAHEYGVGKIIILEDKFKKTHFHAFLLGNS